MKLESYAGEAHLFPNPKQPGKHTTMSLKNFKQLIAERGMPTVRLYTSSPINTTFSPRIIYSPNGMSQYISPTITRSHAPSRTALAAASKHS